MPGYELEFYEDEHGDQPVRRWLLEELSPRKRRALGTAMNRVLQRLGVGVCGTEFGKQLGEGLFEFRLRGGNLAGVAPPGGVPDASESKMLLRVFCHAHGEAVRCAAHALHHSTFAPMAASSSAKRPDASLLWSPRFTRGRLIRQRPRSPPLT